MADLRQKFSYLLPPLKVAGPILLLKLRGSQKALTPGYATAAPPERLSPLQMSKSWGRPPGELLAQLLKYLETKRWNQ